jgi:hypothetical protein
MSSDDDIFTFLSFCISSTSVDVDEDGKSGAGAGVLKIRNP